MPWSQECLSLDVGETVALSREMTEAEAEQRNVPGARAWDPSSLNFTKQKGKKNINIAC